MIINLTSKKLDETFYVSTGTEETANSYKVPIKFLPLYHFVNSKYDKVANASMAALKKNVGDFIDKYESLYIMINMVRLIFTYTYIS